MWRYIRSGTFYTSLSTRFTFCAYIQYEYSLFVLVLQTMVVLVVL